MKKHNIFLVITVVILLTSCSSPGGKITDDSKTEACEQNLLDALVTFSTNLGLPITIGLDDGKTLMDKGEISKKYGMAGYQYTAYFGIEAGENCKLVYYKQKRKGPGESSTTWGDYGSVELTECKCE